MPKNVAHEPSHLIIKIPISDELIRDAGEWETVAKCASELASCAAWEAVRERRVQHAQKTRRG